MNCSKAESLLSSYLDGELSAGDLRSLREHLHQCSGCALELEGLRRVKTLVGSMGTPAMSEAFEARLHAAVFGKPQPVAQPGYLRLGLATGLAAAVLTLGFLQFFKTPKSGDVASHVTPESQSVDLARDQSYFAIGDPISGQAPVTTISNGGR